MFNKYFRMAVVLGCLSVLVTAGVFAAENASDNTTGEEKGGIKVYVPYDKLKDVFEKEGQGVFLPYQEFERLWRAAQQHPAAVAQTPFKYLVSVARFKGKVEGELAVLRLELTVDIMVDDWVQVPLGLGEVAVSQVSFLEPKNPPVAPLLYMADGQYVLMTRGKGRYVLALDFVRQMETRPGLHILKYRLPTTAITTLELLIPGENLKVDVRPMLAATTSQVQVDNTDVTKLQAFLGAADQVELSWKPMTETAAELEPVVIEEQLQHIIVEEALLHHHIRFDYTIHRGGIDTFTIQLPGDFRITEVSGENIAKWEVPGGQANASQGSNVQMLTVKLYSPAKEKYALHVTMERFLQEKQVQLPLTPILTQQALRRTGLIGITHSPRRLVELRELNNLARVDTGRLPEHIRDREGVTAYRFISSDYGGTLAIDTASPRISVQQLWMLGADSDRLELRGRLHYKIDRAGVFELNMAMPEPWKIESIGPETLVDDYQLKEEGSGRTLHILLKKEQMGEFDLELVAQADRTQPEEMIDFSLPLADSKHVQLYQGQLLLLLAEQLQAQVQDVQQLQSISVEKAAKWSEMPGLAPAMAYEFKAIDRDQWAGGKFKMTVKPTEISAVVHRLVNIQPGSLEQEAVVQYRIRFAPADTFYLKMPVELAEAGVQITGANIKEKPRIDALPEDQQVGADKPADDKTIWAYYKIVLQAKIKGEYQLRVYARQAFQAGEVGKASMVDVAPILAAGKLSDQSGHIVITKADTLAIAEPITENLQPADPGSSADVPYEPHRRKAMLAFKYNKPFFVLSLPVVAQKEATVFTTIISSAVIEQVLARDGMINTHAVFLLATSQGDRLPITLPAEAQLTAVLLNGVEVPVEAGLSPDERIVRLPPSAGQVSRFVLEISCSTKDVSASKLTAPAMPEDIPTQQTLWRLWIPEDYYFLGYDRIFSRLNSWQCTDMLRTLQYNQPSQVEFKLPGQGKVIDFVRQGAPGTLSVMVMGKEWFSIIIWVVILAAGALMLKLSGFQRILIILAAALLAGIMHLYWPLLIGQVFITGWFGVILVLLLWASHWLFFRVAQVRKQWLLNKRPLDTPTDQESE
ncbi:MAG: hypothetical protein JW709_02255 [Sedimentisphaerales bacterium]|nr:hypothetical protein [Sedimentisphaerales bacterium]